MSVIFWGFKMKQKTFIAIHKVFSSKMPIKSDFPNVQIDERQFAFQFMEQLATHANDAKKVAIVSFLKLAEK